MPKVATSSSIPPNHNTNPSPNPKVATDDRKVVGITAAMPGGTGMDLFGRRFPSRTYDVGIAEQHAVTFAAAMAAEGLKPFCCIYSTFMQRGYDQVGFSFCGEVLPSVGLLWYKLFFGAGSYPYMITHVQP